MPAPDSVLQVLDARFDEAVEELIALARIPSVSAPGFDPAEVERSAAAVAELLRSVGLESVELLRVPGAHPYVLAEWMGAGEQAPTLVLYAHHDVQPPGRIDYWETPAFDPTDRGDGRLYGRGVVDDKAGVIVYAAAIRAWLEAEGCLPVNIKMVVDGEEEIGSVHLAEFLHSQRERLRADVVVLSDTSNLAEGLPSITTSLRGLVCVDVRVRALDHPLHSGMWGGAVPDAATALAVLLGRLIDDEGRLRVNGLEDDAPPISPSEQERLAALPFDEKAFRSDAGMWGEARLTGQGEHSVYERLWLRPAIAVTALEAMPLADAANQLIAEAAARVGIRLAPGQSPERARDLVMEVLRRDPPWGVEVELQCETLSPGWRTDPEGPAFDAACRALQAGFGREAVFIGCGGSIPFVGPFSQELGGIPALLLGLEDPICNAHGENESLHLGDFQSAIRAAAHLFAELASIPRHR